MNEPALRSQEADEARLKERALISFARRRSQFRRTGSSLMAVAPTYRKARKRTTFVQPPLYFWSKNQAA